MWVGDTGIEPVTPSVSGKCSPTELIARSVRSCRGGDGIRTRVHGFAGRCLASRPLHRGEASTASLRADDGTRTRDPHLGKVMRYQLRYVRARPRRRRRVAHSRLAHAFDGIQTLWACPYNGAGTPEFTHTRTAFHTRSGIT